MVSKHSCNKELPEKCLQASCWFGLSCSLCLPAATPRLPFLLCQHSCLSVKPAQEPNQVKNSCTFVVPLGQLFLRKICFLNCLPSRNTKSFFLAQERQGRQGRMIRMAWEVLLLKHGLGRVKQLFDGLCSCGYTISSTQVWSFGAPSVDCSTMPGTHWDNVSLLWPHVWVLSIFSIHCIWWTFGCPSQGVEWKRLYPTGSSMARDTSFWWGVFSATSATFLVFLPIPLPSFSTISVLAIQHIKEKKTMDLQETDSSPVQLLARGHCRGRKSPLVPGEMRLGREIQWEVNKQTKHNRLRKFLVLRAIGG